MPVTRFLLATVGVVASPIALGPVADVHAIPLGARIEHAIRGETATATRTPLDDSLTGIAVRLETIAAAADRLEADLTAETAVLTRELEEHGVSPELVPRIASALVREGRRNGIAPELLLAVMLVENAPIDPRARSWVGAVGLMQVMPFHAGGWGCGSDLTDPDVNICLGARVLGQALRWMDGDLDRALLQYNGCVVGTNTPHCHRYPQWVRIARAGVSPELPGWPIPTQTTVASNSLD